MPFPFPDFDFDFMSSSTKKSEANRPRPLHTSRSFSRIEPSSPKTVTRTARASTLQDGKKAADQGGEKSQLDILKESISSNPNAYDNDSEEEEERDNDDEEEEEDTSAENNADEKKSTKGFDELPIELISLTDSFIDSLSAKVHPTPPSIDRLSTLFQDFYAVAAQHINTHISALSSRQNRRASPAPSISSLSAAANKLRGKATSIGNNDRPKTIAQRRDSEQQMLTPDEIAARKKARKLLEQKRIALEEAVERRVCEGVYDRIWRHRSTQDEAQDEKLRSKTAALEVVGIGLTDLGIDLGIGSKEDSEEAFNEKEKEVREWLDDARGELTAMSNEKYPLGKLHHLKAAYKEIVDTLAHFHPSSSADEIMPMMIYTLITTKAEGIDAISNLYFVQRFRNEQKLDGEAAYCLTTLEAAISFLETVDLSTLRADESASGPPRLSQPSTPRAEVTDPLILGITPASGISAPETTSTLAKPTITKSTMAPPVLRPAPHNRRISDIFKPPAAFGVASDAVLNTADEGFKTIGNSLGDSYKFLLGKLKERDAASPLSGSVVPKTLDDARKLVSTPPPEDDGSVSGASSLNTPEPGRHRSESGAKVDDKVLTIIGGRKLVRDRSTDSTRSGGSARKVTFSEIDGADKSASPLSTTPTTPGPVNVVDTMRNIGNSFNPMAKIAGMNMMRGFGRPAPPPAPSVTASKQVSDGGVADLTTTFPDLAASLPPKVEPKIAPPKEKFMKLDSPGELRLNEVMELLRDYRRLGNAVKERGLCD